MAVDFSEDDIQDLYAWVDTVPLSRPKRNIARDFSDGVLIAETVSLLFHCAKHVSLHVPEHGCQPVYSLEHGQAYVHGCRHVCL